MNHHARSSAQSLRIVVLGYIVRGPLGGMSWHHLQYMLGLHALGHDVYFVEDSEDYPACYDPSADLMTVNPTYGLRYITDTFSRVGLSDRWAYHDAHQSAWHGPASSRIYDICNTADLVLNLSGINPMRDWTMRIPVRAFVDTDPVFTQVRHLTDPAADALARQHTLFFTFGENFGRPGCTIPGDGLPWQPTRQPVMLDAWPVSAPPAEGAFTTVMQWESYARRELCGHTYGMKAESFSQYFDLPARVNEPLELALGGANSPRELLRRHGWRIADAVSITRDPWSFQDYLRGSIAEFTVAKHGYVVTGSGWFSERSANYLACGRPVVTQDTGFDRDLLSSGGLFAFSTPDEALEAIRAVSGDLKRHGRAARELAEQSFAAHRVLDRLVSRCMAKQPELVG